MWEDLNDWLELKARNTQRKYRATLREFLEHRHIEATEAGFKLLCETTVSDANRFLNWCKSRPSQSGRAKLVADTVSLDTVKQKSVIMFSIFEELITECAVVANPFLKFKREMRKIRGNDRRPHQLIPFEKVTELFELEYKDRTDRTMKGILAVLFGGGLRRSEAIGLRVADVKQTAKGNVYLNLRNTKRQRQEAQALPDWAGIIVQEHVLLRRSEGAKDTQQLFTEYENENPTDRPIAERTLHRRFKKALERVGLVGDFSPHCARATAITMLLEQGVSHRSVAKFSRHTSVDMVAHYDKMREMDGEDVAVQLQYSKKRIAG